MPATLQAYQPLTATPPTWAPPPLAPFGGSTYEPTLPLSEREPSRELAALLDEPVAPAGAEDFVPARRVRRGPLRPPKVIPPSRGRSLFRHLTVGTALEAYGVSRWEIRRNNWFDPNFPAKLTADALRALGGGHTPLGAEYLRRCTMIDSFLRSLARAREAAQKKFPPTHADLVEDEVYKTLQGALETLSAGFEVQAGMPARLEKDIECRIGRRTGGILKRLWGLIAC